MRISEVQTASFLAVTSANKEYVIARYEAIFLEPGCCANEEELTASFLAVTTANAGYVIARYEAIFGEAGRLQWIIFLCKENVP
jgi:hypothetical protein